MTKKVSPALLERHGHMATILRSAMQLKGINQTELARQLGGTASSSTINNWLKAKHGIADLYRSKVAKLLELNEAELLPNPNAVRNKMGRPGKILAAPREQLPALYQEPRTRTQVPQDPWKFSMTAEGKVRFQADILLAPEEAQTLMLQLMWRKNPA